MTGPEGRSSKDTKITNADDIANMLPSHKRDEILAPRRARRFKIHKAKKIAGKIRGALTERAQKEDFEINQHILNALATRISTLFVAQVIDLDNGEEHGFFVKEVKETQFLRRSTVERINATAKVFVRNLHDGLTIIQRASVVDGQHIYENEPVIKSMFYNEGVVAAIDMAMSMERNESNARAANMTQQADKSR